MSRHRFVVPLAILAIVLGAGPALAGAKIAIDENSKLDIGFRVQALTIISSEVDTEGEATTTADWKVRRGRLRVKGMIGKYTTAFVQTDVGSTDGGAGQSARVIDAYVQMKKSPWAQIFMGLNMAPANRQNLTTSGALMALDRPGIAYKSLAWGGRMLRTFSNNTIGTTNAGIGTAAGVRDLGVTLFGSGAVGDAFLKYYLGAYDGTNAAGEDTPHVSARVQLNFFDAEGGYYNSSTYLGKKKTVGIGVSIDQQSKIDVEGGEDVDYMYFSADFFTEWPLDEDRSFTFEGGWMMLDFDDAMSYLAAQGTGFYAQAGYYVNGWQPWGEFEMWSSDAEDDAETGSINQFRFGVSYFLDGQNANIKLGYEMTSADYALLADEDTLNAIVLGLYTTY